MKKPFAAGDGRPVEWLASEMECARQSGLPGAVHAIRRK
jgi:hypothetical protein